MAKTQIRPLRDYVVVKRLEKQEQSRGGIIIPDNAKEKPQEAEVVAIGSGKVLEDGKILPFEVKIGDKVLVGKYSGTEIEVGDEKLVILREEDLLAKMG